MYNVGWDYASHRLLPATEDIPQEFWDGHKESAAHFGSRTLPHDRFVKKWLQLRFNAALRGRSFGDDVTPDFLREIARKVCPITRVNLTYGTLEDTDWSVDRIINTGGYTRCNLMIMSTKANRVKGAMSLQDVRDRIIAKAFAPFTMIEWARLHAVMQNAYLSANMLPRSEYILQPPVPGTPVDVGGTWPEAVQYMIVHHAVRRLTGNKVRSSFERDIAHMNKTINTETAKKLFHKLIKRIEKRLPQCAHEMDAMWDHTTFKIFADLFQHQIEIEKVWPFQLNAEGSRMITEEEIAANRRDLVLETNGYVT